MRGVILDAATLGDANLNPILDNGDQWQVFAHTSESEVLERIIGADIVLTNKVPLKAEVLMACRDLKLIAVTATGTNIVDVNAARKLNIVVCNARNYGSASVAQHTLGLMLNLATNLSGYLEDVRSGAWQAQEHFTLLHRPIFELAGKKLGIVGFGQLGQAVARLASAFDMEVVLVASSNPVSKGAEVYRRRPLREVLQEVDFLSLHCPLTEQNQHLINADTLSLMKPGAFLINTARGGLVDDAALIAALSAGQIAGAAVDVLTKEPPDGNNLLIGAQAKLPNLMITPHNAWGATESRQRLVDQIARVLDAFHADQPINVVT